MRRNRNIARSRRRNGRCEFSARLFNIASIAVVAAAKPLAIGAHRLDTLAFDLGGKHRPEPVPPVSHRLVADLDASLVEQVFDIPQR